MTDTAALVERASTTAAAEHMVGGTKIYGKGATLVRALNDVTVEFLDRLTEGHVFVGEVDLRALNDKAMTVLRREPDKAGTRRPQARCRHRQAGHR